MRASVVAWVGLAGLIAGCAHTGQYVWVDNYREPAPSSDAPYRLAPGDVVALKVYGHDELSVQHVRVRSDGRISAPLTSDVEVRGMSLEALSEILAQRLKPYLVSPSVTATLEEARPFTISVVGEVTRPGVYPVDPHAGVLEALALAGGFTNFAHDDRVFVLRHTREGQPPVRIRFRYEQLAHVEGAGSTFALQRDDVIVVE